MGGQFPMRLAQDAGSLGLQNADIVPTYDQSCAMGKTNGCPHGNVHNVHKQPIGARLAKQIQRMKLGEDVVSQGPRVSSVIASQKSGTVYDIQMRFIGTHSVHLAPTRNFTTCCGDDAMGEFDVSSDGIKWINALPAVVKGGSVHVEVDMLAENAVPSDIRYTANRVYPQCAVFGEEGIPAMPFQTRVAA